MRQPIWKPALAALGLLALVAGGLWLPSAGADAAPLQQSTLIVKCATQDVPQVLKALSGLPVEVYDVETMGRLWVGAPDARPAPLGDAAALASEVVAVVTAAAGDEGAPKVVLEKLQVKANRIDLGLRVANLALLERVRSTLAGSATLMQRTGGTPKVTWGASRPDGDWWRTRVLVPLQPPTGAAVVHDGVLPGFRIERINEAGIRARARLIYASAERSREVRGAVALSQTFEFEADSLEGLLALLEHLPELTEATVTEAAFAWRKGTGAGQQDPRLRAQLTLARWATRAK
ncbi:MAG: hypothetical protein ACC662_07555 [Planctomycetota bacterium]